MEAYCNYRDRDGVIPNVSLSVSIFRQSVAFVLSSVNKFVRRMQKYSCEQTTLSPACSFHVGQVFYTSFSCCCLCYCFFFDVEAVVCLCVTRKALQFVFISFLFVGFFSVLHFISSLILCVFYYFEIKSLREYTKTKLKHIIAQHV